jgi:ribonuclease P protein component
MWEFSREQAHVPAEQSAAQPYPWFSSADADPRWSRRHFGAASQGPQSPVRLTPGRSTIVLPRSLRMRSSKDFRRTTRRGLRASRPTLVVHAARIPDNGPITRNSAGHTGPRIGFVVNGAVGNAVMRNRIKRRLRHLAAAHVTAAPAGTGPETIGPETIGPETIGPETIGPETIGPETIGPETIGIVVRALPRAATNPGELPRDFGSAWHEVLYRLTAGRPERDGGAQ